MSHQSLDEPFSGGLGSYKLYALVAFHLQLHLASGGADSPGEVLLSFLFRFGCCGANRQSDITNQTQLYQHRLVESPDGTSIDLSNVFKLQECVKLFEVCWKRIWDRVDSAGRNNAISRTINPINMQSLLALLVCPNRLRLEREAAVLAVGDWREKISVLNERQKSMAERQKSKEKHQKLIAKKKKYILRQREKFAGGVTSRLRSSGPLSKQTVGSSQVSLERNLKDLTTAELMAGYGVESAIDLTSP